MTPIHETLVHQKKVIRLQPPQRLDLQAGVTLRQQIAAIEPEQDSLWLVDMAHVEFVDGAGRLALVEALNFAQRSQCRLLLCHLRPSIKIIFELTQLDQIFEIVESSTELTRVGMTADVLAPRATAIAA
jgi:anti-anti-sigma factor